MHNMLGIIPRLPVFGCYYQQNWTVGRPRNEAVSLKDQLHPQSRTHVDRDFAGKKPETRNSKKLLKMYKLELLQVHMCLVSFPDPRYWGGLTH